MKNILLLTLYALCLGSNIACNANANHDSATRSSPQTLTSPQSPNTPQSPSTPSEIASDEGKQIIKTAHGRSMVYRFQPGTKTPVWVLIHGLADDMTQLNDLADLAMKQGYPVLQMDLQGHGETLKEALKNDPKLPEKLNFKDNVEDIQILLASLKIPEVVIIGHSYGGGIAFDLATELRKSGKARVRSLHMLAPYVQRIDKFMRNRSVMGRMFPMTDATDDMMDPILEKFLEQSYRTYITETFYGGNYLKLTEAQKAEVEVRVKAAILSTKGIRSFDLLDKANPIPTIDTALHILGGENDQLVVPRQLHAFEDRLEEQKLPFKLDFLKGASATHLFPRTMPAQSFKLILKFQAALP